MKLQNSLFIRRIKANILCCQQERKEHTQTGNINKGGNMDFRLEGGGTSLVVQRLRLCAPNGGGLGSIPGQGTRSHMLQLRPGAAKKKRLQ